MTDRALIICVSVHHGSTVRVAHAMAEVLHARVATPEEVDPATLAEYDIVGFGSGVYYGSVHPRLRRYVEGLPAGQHARAFVFTTSGRGREQHLPWERPLSALLTAKGFTVVGSFDRPAFDSWGPFGLLGGLNRHRPDAHDLSAAHEFAVSIVGVPAA